MRVAVIIPSFYPAVVYGGSTFASYHLTKAASDNGLKIHVSTTNANGDKRLAVAVNKFTDLDGFQVKYYHEQKVNHFSLSYLLGIWKDIRTADVVHIQSIFSYPTPIALFYAFIQRKKVLLSPRGSLAAWSFQIKGSLKKAWLSFFIKPFVKKCTWHATSEKEANDIYSLFPKAQVELITDGTFVEEYQTTTIDRKDLLKRFDLSDGDYLAAMGRIHTVKGYDLLIESMLLVQKEFPKLKLLIAGQDEGDLKKLIKLLQKHALEEKVHFVGSLKGEEKQAFLKHAHALVLPSHTENFGIVVVEALACGTAVIASNKTPWAILEKAKAGYWLENTSPSLAKGITNLLSNTSIDWERNAKLLSQEFDWGTVAKRYKQVLEKIYNE